MTRRVGWRYPLSVCAMLVSFHLLIATHELGHASVALGLDYRIRSITVGCGPRLFRAQVRDTWLEVRLLPLVGHVEIGGGNSWHPRPAASVSGPSGMSRLIRIAALHFVAVALAGPAAGLFLGLGLLCAYVALNRWRFARQDLNVMDDPRRLGGFLSIVFYGAKCLCLRPQAALLYVAAISLSLSVTNLLPLFPLDGAFVPLAIYMVVSGRRLDPDTSREAPSTRSPAAPGETAIKQSKDTSDCSAVIPGERMRFRATSYSHLQEPTPLPGLREVTGNTAVQPHPYGPMVR